MPNANPETNTSRCTEYLCTAHCEYTGEYDRELEKAHDELYVASRFMDMGDSMDFCTVLALITEDFSGCKIPRLRKIYRSIGGVGGSRNDRKHLLQAILTQYTKGL